MPIKVLVVDDSSVVRRILSTELARDPEIEVVGVAVDPYAARDKIVRLEPDVITLDLEMPRMDGITFLQKLMAAKPMPVVVVSSLAQEGGAMAMQALESGAVDVMCKPGSAYSVGDLAIELANKVKAAAKAKLRVPAAQKQNEDRSVIQPRGNAMLRTTNQVVAIGASTGGTEALRKVIPRLPPSTPGVLVTLHMPAQFTAQFAASLDRESALMVREASDGDAVAPGQVLVAPGNQHMTLTRSGARYVARVKDGPRVNRHRPSVDVLLQSVAQNAGANAVGVILTGMGDDGARGLLNMKEHGARTLAQDEASCVVFGMPKVAIELGAVDQVAPIDAIPYAIVDLAHVSDAMAG